MSEQQKDIKVPPIIEEAATEAAHGLLSKWLTKLRRWIGKR